MLQSTFQLQPSRFLSAYHVALHLFKFTIALLTRIYPTHIYIPRHWTQKETISEIHFTIISRLRCSQMMAYLKIPDTNLLISIVGFFLTRRHEVNFIRWSSFREIFDCCLYSPQLSESSVLLCSAHEKVPISPFDFVKRRCQMSLNSFCEDRIKSAIGTQYLRSSILNHNTLAIV